MENKAGGILFKEKNNESKVAVIIIQGMADLGEIPNKMIADALEADIYDPKWHDNNKPNIESDNPFLEKRLTELDEKVTELVNNGKMVVLVGISAGAGFAMYYMKSHPDKVRLVLSVGGVLNPNPNLKGGKFPDLMRDSETFCEMTDYLHEWYQQPGVEQKLKEEAKVIAYVSSELGKDGDGMVPGSALAPEWAIIKKTVFPMGHVGSIAVKLLGEVKMQIEELREAKID